MTSFFRALALLSCALTVCAFAFMPVAAKAADARFHLANLSHYMARVTLSKAGGKRSQVMMTPRGSTLSDADANSEYIVEFTFLSPDKKALCTADQHVHVRYGTVVVTGSYDPEHHSCTVY